MNHFCGFRLSTVGVAIGWLNLVGSFFSTVGLIVALARLDELIKYIETSSNSYSPNDEAEIKTAVLITLCVFLTTSLINLIASALLIVGTVKERHLLLAPWLINTYIFIFFNTLNLVYMIYMSISKGVVFPTFATLFSTAFYLIVLCTIWNAICALFKEIRANRDMQQRLLVPTSSGGASGAGYTNYSKMPMH